MQVHGRPEWAGRCPNTVCAPNVQFGWTLAIVEPTCFRPRKNRIVTLPWQPHWAGIDAVPIDPVVLST